MNNNKGQVLVLFVLLLPVLLMLLALVIDLGLLMVRTYHVKDSVKEAIKYGLTNDDIEGMEVMLKKNITDTYNLSTNGNIEIEVSGTYRATLGKIFNKDLYKYQFKYLGYKDGDKIIIREE